MQRVLITGATGFIGSHLAAECSRRGYRVRCLVRRPPHPALSELGLEQVEGDVMRPETLGRAVCDVDAVFHAAGLLAAVHRSDLYQVNGQGTAHVVEACAGAANPPALVLVSSLAAAGPVPRGTVRGDDDPPNPVSHYGRSKRQGELAVTGLAGQVPVTVVRPGVVFGQQCRELRPMLSTIYRFRFHPVPGWRCPPLSYIHVEDLVELLIRCAAQGQRLAQGSEPAATDTRGYYFAADGEYPDWAQFGRLFALALGRPYAPVVRIPDPLPYLLGAAGDCAARLRGRAGMINGDKMLEARAASWACSSERARRELDFQPSCDLRARIQQTADWFREQRWL
ncbi:MAG: NAD-dependent epimerase/dehydratase family protein [Pirellulaceae bacterium]|nr:NAD-dependent epimerase/dehydratase family protein [Pirellulaceae bacterium]